MNAEGDEPLFFLLGERAALLCLIVGEGNLLHGRWNIQIVADYVEYAGHNLLQLFRGAMLALVDNRKQIFLYVGPCDFVYVLTFKCYIQDETKITIPAMWNGKPVTRIQSGVFQGNSILESIVLPNCLQYIGESAFAGRDALCIVEIDSDSELKEIAAHAFQGCDSLKSIYLPGQLCYIGEYAFEGTSLISAVFAKPTNWNLFGTWNGYIADLSPTNALNAGKALSTTYESHGSSNFYQTAWIRSDAYSNGTIPTTYEKEL